MHQSALSPVFVMSLITHCASSRLTLVLLAVLGAAVVAGYLHEPLLQPALSLALALLAANLLAAAAVRPVFRRQLPLLVMHLALFALVLLVLAGRLTSLQGRMELTQGVVFDGQLLDQASGPLHRPRLSQAAFVHDGFDIEYAPGMKRGRTRNAVRWIDAGGTVQHAVIGDQHPLVLHGYRFYTTPNKGYAPMFTWWPQQGDAVRGSVHLPSYPVHQLRQAREWTLPDGTALWVMLRSEETVIDPARPSAFAMPRDRAVVLRVGEQRFELSPGGRVALEGGVLAYDGLQTWMGYRIAYDWTLAWLLAASVLAALALGLHFALRFRSHDWRVPQPAAGQLPGGHAAAPPLRAGVALR